MIPSYSLSYTSLFWICKHGKYLFNKSLQSHTQSSHAVIVHSYRQGQESKKPHMYSEPAFQFLGCVLSSQVHILSSQSEADGFELTFLVLSSVYPLMKA